MRSITQFKHTQDGPMLSIYATFSQSNIKYQKMTVYVRNGYGGIDADKCAK